MQRKPLTKFNIHLWKKKDPPESRPRRNIPQHNKSHIWQTHSKHYPQWWKIESISSNSMFYFEVFAQKIAHIYWVVCFLLTYKNSQYTLDEQMFWSWWSPIYQFLFNGYFCEFKIVAPSPPKKNFEVIFTTYSQKWEQDFFFKFPDSEVFSNQCSINLWRNTTKKNFSKIRIQWFFSPSNEIKRRQAPFKTVTNSNDSKVSCIELL